MSKKQQLPKATNDQLLSSQKNNISNTKKPATNT